MAKRPAVDTREELGNALASALTTWNQVEGELAMILADCLMQQHAGKVARIYWIPNSFQARLGMVSESVKSELGYDPAVIDPWNRLHQRAEQLVKHRNKLAHGTIMSFEWPFEEERQQETCFVPYPSMMLVNNFEDLVRLDARPRDRISVHSMNGSIAAFRTLENDLGDFRRVVFDRMQLSHHFVFQAFMRGPATDRQRDDIMARFTQAIAEIVG